MRVYPYTQQTRTNAEIAMKGGREGGREGKRREGGREGKRRAGACEREREPGSLTKLVKARRER